MHASPLSRKASFAQPPMTPRRGTVVNTNRAPSTPSHTAQNTTATASRFGVPLTAPSEHRRTSLLMLLRASNASPSEIRDAERRLHEAISLQAARHEQSLNIGCGRGLTPQELDEAIAMWNRSVAGHTMISSDELLALRRQTVTNSETLLSMLVSLNVRLHDFVVEHVRRKFAGELGGKANISDFLKLLAETKVLVEAAYTKDPLMSDDFIDAFIAVGGNKDGTGCVDAARVVKIAQKFDVTCDVHSWLADGDSDGDNKIDFAEFCDAFSGGGSDSATPSMESMTKLAVTSEMDPSSQEHRGSIGYKSEAGPARRASVAVTQFLNTQSSVLGQTSSSTAGGGSDTPTRLLARLQQLTDPTAPRASNKATRHTGVKSTLEAASSVPDPQLEAPANRLALPPDAANSDVTFARERAQLRQASQQLIARSSTERKRRELAEQHRGGHLQVDFRTCTLQDVTRVGDVPQSKTMRDIAGVINSTASRSVPMFRKQLARVLRRQRNPASATTSPSLTSRSPNGALPLQPAPPPTGPAAPTPRAKIAVFSTAEFTLKSEDESRAFRERRARDELDAMLDRQEDMMEQAPSAVASHPDGASSSDDDDDDDGEGGPRHGRAAAAVSMDAPTSVYMTTGTGPMVRKSVVAPKPSLHRDDSMVIDLKLAKARLTRRRSTERPRPAPSSPRTTSLRAALAAETARGVPAVVLEAQPISPSRTVEVKRTVPLNRQLVRVAPPHIPPPTNTDVREPPVGVKDDRLQTWYYRSPPPRQTSKPDPATTTVESLVVPPPVQQSARQREAAAAGEAGFLLIPPSALLL